jgi:hypothetical protein
VEYHSSRLEQVKVRKSELKDKIEIKNKTEKILVKQLKSCERNMQELSDSIKRPDLKIMGNEEEVQAKEISNICNKIIRVNFPNLKKVLPIWVQEASRQQTDLTKTQPLYSILSLKQQAQRMEKEY